MLLLIQWHRTGTHQLQRVVLAVLNASLGMTQIAQRGQHRRTSTLYRWKEKKLPNVEKKSPGCVLSFCTVVFLYLLVSEEHFGKLVWV